MGKRICGEMADGEIIAFASDLSLDSLQSAAVLAALNGVPIYFSLSTR